MDMVAQMKPELVRINEEQLGDGKLDLNGDGVFEFVDYDSDGTIWSDLTTTSGAHDTQHEMILAFRTNRCKFNKPTTKWTWNRDPATKLLFAKIEDKVEGICGYLRSATISKLFFEYCDMGPALVLTDMDQASTGDYDGDGFMDRIRFKRRPAKPARTSHPGLRRLLCPGQRHYLHLGGAVGQARPLPQR